LVSQGKRVNFLLWFFANLDYGIEMIQCKGCEFFGIGPNSGRTFKCDPFTGIKEPECITKWQLIRLDMLLSSYQGMLRWYGKLEPLQDKIFKYMQREIEDMEETERWKLDDEEPEENR